MASSDTASRLAAGATTRRGAAAVVVINPAGNRTRLPLDNLPFTVGRHSENTLELRDTRVSRFHSRIVAADGHYWVEDLESRHGTWVNGERVTRRALSNADRIEFGLRDSYQLIFTVEEDEIHRLLGQLVVEPKAGGAGNLAKLRALVEVARALQSSLSVDDVLAAVVDAALVVTGAERGFLLLMRDGELMVRVARDRNGRPLPATDLKVPARLIQRALNHRRELLSMNFDPAAGQDVQPDLSVARLELRSVVCVPLIRIRSGSVEEETLSATVSSDSVGLIYMDSRSAAADLSSGNRELLQTLALEASTILENARLLEEDRRRQELQRELDIARDIQAGLLPRRLPSSGWFRACGSSLPSSLVGGDYFDVREMSPSCWFVVVTDVCGKGVSSALLATLLQGSFLLASESPGRMEELLQRVNHFLNERTGGEKYATVFYSYFDASGLVRYINAGHCPPIVVRRRDSRLQQLGPTGVPIGLLEMAGYAVEEMRLEPGDKLIAFSDGLTDAQDGEGTLFGLRRLREAISACAGGTCAEIHAALIKAVETFTAGAPQLDDITLLVVEYQPD